MMATSPVEHLPQTATDLAAWTALQTRAVHVRRAPGHRRPGVDVLLNGMGHETLRREHRHFSGVDVGLRGDTEHTAEMVDVAVV